MRGYVMEGENTPKGMGILRAVPDVYILDSSTGHSVG